MADTRKDTRSAVQERAGRPRNRHPSGEGTRQLDPEENLRAQDARDHVLASPNPDEVVLFNYHYPFWRFGPGAGSTAGVWPDHIVFGPEPHVAKVPIDHPLLLPMLRADPTMDVIIGQPVDEPVEIDQTVELVDVFIDPFTGQEFGSMSALAAHMREAYDITPPKIRRASRAAMRAEATVDEPTTKKPVEVPDDDDDDPEETAPEEPTPEDK
jgi:hypothetical protein